MNRPDRPRVARESTAYKCACGVVWSPWPTTKRRRPAFRLCPDCLKMRDTPVPHPSKARR